MSMAEEDHKMQTTQQEKNYHTHKREHVLTPLEKPQETKEVNLDDDHKEQDHSSRSYHSGGRGKPSRKEIGEWAYDPYCE